MKRRNKNISRNIKIGTIIQTRDEHFQYGVPKPEYVNRPNNFYRKSVVVETNKDDKLGLVKFVSRGNSSVVSKKGKTYNYKPYLEIFDKDGSSIKVGNYFKKNTNDKILVHEVNKIKKDLYKNNSTSYNLKKINRRKVRFLKGRQ